tara:strand:- start:55062 stop:56162 length:1101 start_codon:yes stop_codon:yes gene_type:complete
MTKVAVYAIAKNESFHVDRWYSSVKDADGIFVLDTGSEDNTVQMLEAQDEGCPIEVFRASFDPFRFDIARNFVLNQIPSDFDYVMFMDLDEVVEPGWKQAIIDMVEEDPSITAINTRMVFDVNPDGSPGTTYNRLMVTRNGMYRWVYPVHEVLDAKNGVPVNETFSDIRVRHLPDPNKSRSDYLNLLYIAAQERPTDPRCAQYLAKELAGRGRTAEALAEFRRHLTLENNTWFRCETMRMMAYCHEADGDTLEARNLHTAACAEAPELREPWGDAAAFYMRVERYHSALGCVESMMDVTEPPQHTIIRNDAYYGAWPHHVAAVCYHRLGDTASAQRHIRIAASLSPNDVSILTDMVTICDIPVEEK